MSVDRYLYTHFKGVYRTFPELTTDGDFIRDEDGNIDEDYADFYLAGKSGIKIKHGVGSELWFYCPKIGVGKNVIRQYYTLVFGKEMKDAEKASKKLIEAGYMVDCDILDEEVCFTFNVKYLDTLAKILKLKTSGSKISPLSSKNLRTTPYTIPEKDLEAYRKAKEGIEPLKLGRLNSEFGEAVIDNYKSELKMSRMKSINFIHSKGVWKKYCEFLKNVER